MNQIMIPPKVTLQLSAQTVGKILELFGKQPYAEIGAMVAEVETQVLAQQVKPGENPNAPHNRSSDSAGPGGGDSLLGGSSPPQGGGDGDAGASPGGGGKVTPGAFGRRSPKRR